MTTEPESTGNTKKLSTIIPEKAQYYCNCHIPNTFGMVLLSTVPFLCSNCCQIYLALKEEVSMKKGQMEHKSGTV